MAINIGPEIIASLIGVGIIMIGGIIHFNQKLTEISIDIKWIKKQCPKCNED